MSPRGRPLVAVGIVLVAGGLVHLGVWGVLGGPWEGPVTWRKPILFGISGGLTALSLAWAWERLPWRRGDGWLAAATAAALFVEVALIDMQCWRGLASHFNRRTPFDSLLYDLMGVLIVGVSLVSLDLTVRFFREPVALPADMLLAARAGLVFLVISCGLGIWASVHGEWRQQAGLAPELFGAAGVTKFPHGMVIHALQWLPAFAWAARRAGIRAGRRVRLVAVATAGTACLGLYALVQTLAGRARFDAPPLSAILLVAGLVGLAGPAAAILAAAFTGRSSRAGSSRPEGPTGARRAAP